MSTLGVQQRRDGFGLLAVKQDEFTLRSGDGLFRTRIVKILRIDHRPFPANQYPGVPVARTQWLPPTSQRSITKPPEVSKATPKIVRPTPQRKRTAVGLRTVGEVLTDNEGHLYEMRDQEIHRLGKLVRDSQGRLFEVCVSTERSLLHLLFTNPIQLLKRLASVATRWSREGRFQKAT